MYVCHCRLKASSVNLKVELYMNGDQIDPSNDRKLVTQLGIRDKTVSQLVWISVNLVITWCIVCSRSANVAFYRRCLFVSLPVSQKRRLMLFGHLARMDESADARRIVTAVPQSDWTRPTGRPHTACLITMKNDLSYHNLSVEDATELALDRPLWRLLTASRATHWNGASWTMMMMMLTQRFRWWIC